MVSTRQLSTKERHAIVVREFKKMLPSLTAYVRALTGNRQVKVVMDSNSGTDGIRVALRPPAALADPKEHDRLRCGQRENNELVCPACRRLEAVYVVLYHEISHIVSGSLEQQAILGMEAVATQAAHDYGTPEYRTYIEERVDALGPGGDMDAYEYGQKLSPHLLNFVRAFDDYRIDREAARARPGVETMRYHQSEVTLRRGIDLGDGTVQHYRDRSLEAQIPVAMLLYKQGHDIVGHFDDRMMPLFVQPDIADVLSEPLENMGDVLYAAVGALGALNQFGLYDIPVPPPPAPLPGSADDEPEPRTENSETQDQGEPETDPIPPDQEEGQGSGGDTEDAGGAEGENAEHSDGDGGPDPENYGDDAGDADADGEGAEPDDHEESGRGVDEGDPADVSGLGSDGDDADGEPVPDGGTAPDPSPPPDFSDEEHASEEEIAQALEDAFGHTFASLVMNGEEGEGLDPFELEQALVKALFFDDTETTVTGVKVFKNGEPSPGWRGSGARTWRMKTLDRQELSPSILRARRLFNDSRLDRTVRNLKRGRVASRALGARAWNPEEDRLFQRKIRGRGADDELLIAMDLSGSTVGSENLWIRQTAHAMADVLAAVGVRFSIYGHTTDDSWEDRCFEQHIYQVKAADDPWTEALRQLLIRLPALEGSLDGHNFEFYRKVLASSSARRKTLVYFTDGRIPETNHNEEVLVIDREMRIYKQLGIGILVVAFDSDAPSDFGMDTIRIDGPDDIITVIQELETRITSVSE